jgi:Fe-S cluster assembly protein SufD
MSNSPKIITHKKSGRGRRMLADFTFTQDQLPKLEDPRLMRYHQSAWDVYQTLPFPSLTDEPWRRTDIRELNTSAFSLHQGTIDGQQPPARLLDPMVTGEKRAGQIVSGAVKNVASLDPDLVKKGVIFTDLFTAEEKYPDLVDSVLGQVISPDEDKFTALAAALASDGVFLYVPKNVIIQQPLHSLYWGDGEDKAFINHLVVWIEEGAQVTFVHESASHADDTNTQLFHDGIVEIHVGRNARLNFVELQSWGKNVWSFTRERARVMGDGNLEWVFGAMGTHLTKNFSDIDLVESGAMGRMSGFYFASDGQHLDHDTQQNHLAMHTTSDLLYKGALLDQSRSVWQGMIYVAPGAIGADGYQANRNLILSKAARVDSIPGLEILTDDVRCTHGATIGKIDEDELFYLLSRGIPEKQAEQLIVMGFFTPIMDRIPFEGVQKRFSDAIREKMAGR